MTLLIQIDILTKSFELTTVAKILLPSLVKLGEQHLSKLIASQSYF